MAYRLWYHPAVPTVDLPRINANFATTIQHAIERRLRTEPSYYGEPLRHRLKGYWRLRVGEHRIIYRIVGHEVLMLRIGHRKDVYDIPLSRLEWRPPLS